MVDLCAPSPSRHVQNLDDNGGSLCRSRNQYSEIQKFEKRYPIELFLEILFPSPVMITCGAKLIFLWVLQA